MNRVDEIIQELCPEGVAHKELGEVLGIVEGSSRKIVKSKIQENGAYPVYTQGANQKPDGYSDDKDAVINDTPLILYGDHTNALKWIDHDFIAGADGVKLVKSSQDSGLDNRFLYHCLRDKIKQIPSGYARHFAQLRKLTIPIPPLEVQKEIVNILDKFTQLEAELSAELSAELNARRKQYKYYLNQLLTIGDAAGVRRTTLGEIGEFTRGNGPQKKDFTDNGIGCIHYGQIYTHYGTFTDKTKIFVSEEVAKRSKKAMPGNLVIATTSENDEDVCKAVAWLGDSEIAISNHTAIFAHNENPKYMAYLFQTQDFFKQKKRYIKGTKVKDVSADSIAKFEVSLPLRDEQDRIVDIIDKFDALTNSISEGLPAEINARRKQYEYYRTKLLTFQELPA